MAEGAAVDPVLARLRAMEDANRKLLAEVKAISEQNRLQAEQYSSLQNQYEDLSTKVRSLNPDRAVEPAKTIDGSSGNNVEANDGGLDLSIRGLAPRKPKTPANVWFDAGRSGLLVESPNEEFQLRVRTEVQVDARAFARSNQSPVSDGFYLPRARLYFSGRMTRPIEYQVSVARGFDSFNLLNAYLNFNYDDRFQIKAGRFKTPFTYEFYKMHNWQLLSPERSLFAENFAAFRQIGVMAWGELIDKRLEYAVGVFDGPRSSFQDFNGAKDVIGLINVLPFRGTGSVLENLNIGGSVDYGDQNNPLQPTTLRTSVNASTDSASSTDPVSTANVPFLEFNKNVTEKGTRSLYEFHLAYFYRGLSLLGSWDSGYSTYGLNNNGTNTSVRVPVGGYYAQVGYLLTGETRDSPSMIDPLNPFDLRRGRFGLGAIELTGRYSELRLGSQVFTGGLADPSLWTNYVQMTDVGLNWYLNRYTKVYLDWQHAIFATPVQYAPGPLRQSTSDMFWLRLQFYY